PNSRRIELVPGRENGETSARGAGAGCSLASAIVLTMIACVLVFVRQDADANLPFGGRTQRRPSRGEPRADVSQAPFGRGMRRIRWRTDGRGGLPASLPL